MKAASPSGSSPILSRKGFWAGRDLVRATLSFALQRIPDSVLLPLRRSFPQTSPESMNHRFQELLLRILHVRGIPQDVSHFSPTDNTSIAMVNAESFVNECLYWYGERYGYEPAGIHWWKQFCRGSSSIVELGANVGYYTVQGAKAAPHARYLAVEPHPRCAALCRENLALNDIFSVEVLEAAAVAEATSATVELLLPGGKDHYLEAPCTGFVGAAEGRPPGEVVEYPSVEVPAVELRRLVPDGMDLLKMDVEGQEHALLCSIVEYLRHARPTVFVELLEATPQLRSLLEELCTGTGYRCFVPQPDRLVPLDPAELLTVSLSKTFKTRDVILTCRSLEDLA